MAKTLEGYGATVTAAKEELLKLVREAEAEVESAFEYVQTGMHEYKATATVAEKKEEKSDTKSVGGPAQGEGVKVEG